MKIFTKKSLLSATAVMSLVGFICTAQAVVPTHTLTDLNTTVDFKTDSQDGMFNWTVDGVDHLQKQWFWYRVGGGTEASVDTLMPSTPLISDTNSNSGFDILALKFTDPNGKFTIETNYLLTGGTAGSKTSDIAETIRIINTTGGMNQPPAETLDFHFFQYTDLHLNATALDDTVEILGAGFNTVQQTDSSIVFNETVVTPPPSFHEAGLGVGGPVLTKLNDPFATTLGNISGPLGPGDAEWGYQWRFSIAAGDTRLISKDKSLRPGDTTTLGTGLGSILLLGLSGLIICRRKGHTNTTPMFA